MVPELGRYERWANSIGNMIKIKPSRKDREKLQKFLDTAHLDVTAGQAVTLALLSMLGVFFLTMLVAVAIYLIDGSVQLTLIALGLMASVFAMYYTYSMPQRLANIWKLRASAEMVPAILYIVVYMKHTSNLERAVAFAAQHLEGPLALDFKKVFYDVEIGKFSTIKQSIDDYLERWRGYAPEFVESFHLIESSLFEPLEGRRIEILEKSLQIILDGVYEKMLKYSREIRTPLTNIYMLGVILPTLGTTMLIVLSSFVDLELSLSSLMIVAFMLAFIQFMFVSIIKFSRPAIDF